MTCGRECEVYSRVVGYLRPVQNWNAGKREEFGDRLVYKPSYPETPSPAPLPPKIRQG